MNRSVSRLDRWFLPAMSVVIAMVVVYGFSFTVAENLLHPAYPRPWVLYVHAIVTAGWILLFITQAALVGLRRVDLHRRLGRWGLVHGATIPVLAVATALAMARVRLAHGEAGAADSLPIPINDAVAFTATFALAGGWRKRPEYHRRLMFLATCVLTAAAFGRIPALDHAEWFYLGVDALILAGALRDRVVEGRVHPVYRYGLPAIVIGQLITACVRWTPQWLALAPRLFAASPQ